MLFLLYIKIKLENMIKIMPTFNPVFRPEKEKSEKIVETYFSAEEKNNTAGNGDFMIKLLNKDNQEEIGTMTYDYDENSERPMIKIRTVGVDIKYQRQDFSKKMYQFLIDLAKTKKLNGVKSDQVVQGGALASWKKIKDDGYDVLVHPELENKFEEFCKFYNENKFFKDSLSAPSGESVFTINL